MSYSVVVCLVDPLTLSRRIVVLHTHGSEERRTFELNTLDRSALCGTVVFEHCSSYGVCLCNYTCACKYHI